MAVGGGVQCTNLVLQSSESVYISIGLCLDQYFKNYVFYISQKFIYGRHEYYLGDRHETFNMKRRILVRIEVQCTHLVPNDLYPLVITVWTSAQSVKQSWQAHLHTIRAASSQIWIRELDPCLTPPTPPHLPHERA